MRCECSRARDRPSTPPPPSPSPSPFLHALSTPRHLPDAWALAHESSLRLHTSAGKATLEAAGIRGKRMREAFRGCEEQYRASSFSFLSLPCVKANTPASGWRWVAEQTIDLCQKEGASRTRAALERWDQTRQQTGQGEWEFSYYTEDPGNPHAPKLSYAPH